MGRDEHAWYLDLERDVAGEQWARAAGCDEREVPRIVATPHGVQLDRLRHAVLLDLERPQRGLLDRHVEPVGDGAQRLLRELRVEGHGSPQQSPVRP